MTSWERTFFRLLLQTTRRPTHLPLAKLLGLLEKERPHIRAYWQQQNRIVLTHVMISSMREGCCPNVLIAGRWNALVEYMDTSWRLYEPGRLRKVRLLDAFLEFKQEHDSACQ